MQPARFVMGLIGLSIAAFSSSAADAPVNPGMPLSPEQGLKSIRVKEGFAVELAAAEPLVADPVAIAWGPDGKLWVVEMADYPVGADGNPAPPNGSRIRYLEDTDEDGKYDKSTLFMEGVSFPNGILPWRNGVLVTAAPEIFYAEDTDGDGKADKKEVLYSGFTEGNPQLRINGLRWGLDNWVYLANGWSSRGKVKSHKTGAEVEVSGRDLRIRPDTGVLEAVEGMTEFGRERDDWGDWFGCDNAHPMWHFVLPERYTKRNPHVAPSEPREQLIKPFPPRVYAASKPARRYNAFDIQDHFQSACSAMVYRDEQLFPCEDGRRHAFVCDPVHNLIHHSILTEAGVTFTAARAADEQDREFFASTDNWCRPVMALTGPDGALWVVDMYRFMVEHPEYLPPIGKKELEPFYRLGDDKGRIYRVVRENVAPRKMTRLTDLNIVDLVNALNSPNGWRRDTAQMMLLWRGDHAAVQPLQRLISTSDQPLARLHALCTLEGLGAVTPEILVALLGDAHPGVRRQALRVAEAHAHSAPVLSAALKLAEYPDLKVRLQLAFSAGEWDGHEAGRALASIALGPDGDDPYLTAAVLSSAGRHFKILTEALLSTVGRPDAAARRGLIRMAALAGDTKTAAALLAPVLKPVDGSFSAGQFRTFAEWLDMPAAKEVTLEGSAVIFDAALRVVGDDTNPDDWRVAAASLLGRRPDARERDLKTVSNLLSPRSPPELRRAAVAAAGRTGGERVPIVLLEKWNEHSPDLRGAVVDLLLGSEAWTTALLDDVDGRRVAPADIDLARRQRLINHSNPSIKRRAGKLLAETVVASNRQKVLDANAPVLSMTGDGKRGAEMFRQHCAVCHQLNGQGQDVGPNLESVREWTGEAMLTAILDPNRQAEPKYLAYTATTVNGEPIFGIVAAESGNGVTMKGLDGKDRAILRDDLKSLVSSSRSLMPDGFESAMTRQQLADLMEFLKAPERAK